MNTNHTPTPWHIVDFRILGKDREGKLVLVGDVGEEDARYVCQCVNAHDGLVAALEEISSLPIKGGGDILNFVCDLKVIARAALAKVKP